MSAFPSEITSVLSGVSTPTAAPLALPAKDFLPLCLARVQSARSAFAVASGVLLGLVGVHSLVKAGLRHFDRSVPARLRTSRLVLGIGLCCVAVGGVICAALCAERASDLAVAAGTLVYAVLDVTRVAMKYARLRRARKEEEPPLSPAPVLVPAAAEDSGLSVRASVRERVPHDSHQDDQ